MGLLTSRYNPYHAKDGKFASKNGLGGSSFNEMDHAAAVDEQTAINWRDFNSPSATEHTMHMLAERQLEGVRVFAGKDDARLYVHKNAKVDDEHLGKFMVEIDAIRTAHPHPMDLPLRVQVQPDYKFVAPGGGGRKFIAETVISRPDMRFSESLVMGRITQDTSHQLHPAGFYRNPLRNTVVHEWGHAITPDPRRAGVQQRMTSFHNAHKDGLSRYGRVNPFEGIAEAFSDMETSPRNRWMKSTPDYIKEYGWVVGGI